jgi:hypothetical protein
MIANLYPTQRKNGIKKYQIVYFYHNQWGLIHFEALTAQVVLNPITIQLRPQRHQSVSNPTDYGKNIQFGIFLCHFFFELGIG